METDTLSGPEGHRRHKCSEADFDPRHLHSRGESVLEAQRGSYQRDGGHAVPSFLEVFLLFPPCIVL
jgi:hypothetical protein